MKTINKALILLVLSLGSCSDSEFFPSGRDFVVDRVDFDGHEWNYRASPVIGMGNHYFKSKEDLKYQLGDTLYLSQCR